MTVPARIQHAMIASFLLVGLSWLWPAGGAEARTVFAELVAIDQPVTYNRYGTADPAGMIFALRRDVTDASGVPLTAGGGAVPGLVRLRSDKRPRPPVLRVNAGDTLEIRFQNLLSPLSGLDGAAVRKTSVRVLGLSMTSAPRTEDSEATGGPGGLVSPGATAVYTYFAARPGTFLFESGGTAGIGFLEHGLFGAVNVLPAGAEAYRSQLTRSELDLATTGRLDDGHPFIDYDTVYPPGHRYAGLPVLRMWNGDEIVHSDLTAIVTGPNRGSFPPGTFRDVQIDAPSAADEPRSRNEAYRELTVILQDSIAVEQAFPEFSDARLGNTLASVRDASAVNYGADGLGSAVIAQRRGVGPARDCVECKFGEFFASSWAVGDPAVLVDIPANGVDPGTGRILPGPKARTAFFPDDPSNVQHGYIGDHLRVAVLNAGKTLQGFHLHGHQWLSDPSDDNSAYRDGETIGPGEGRALEVAYNGGGNRNMAVGDALLASGSKARFARGMWTILRIHDVFEAGTVLDSTGKPAAFSRALPDGEIPRGVPIPAVVPIPGRPMAPVPGAAHVASGQMVVDEAGKNPGYPFFIPGRSGHRAPQPPFDLEEDGGLPRHVVLGGTARSVETRLDFGKVLQGADVQELPNAGTAVERTAMAYHADRFHETFTPEGVPAYFRTNGLPAAPGAPFADPCVDDFGNPAGSPRTYRAAALQMDLTLNRAGWHTPQAAVMALRDDVRATLGGTRPPEPLFVRANTSDCVTVHHTNLTSGVHELDDYQPRLPVDVAGWHAHLVKADLTASDGFAAGFNYEDGALSPRDVRERIQAINAFGGVRLQAKGGRKPLAARPHPFYGVTGAQTATQRWFVDDVRNNEGVDRTLGTAATDDLFNPSMDGGGGGLLLAEPEGSVWRDSETGRSYGSRVDGGPTGWRADVLTSNGDGSVREFAFVIGKSMPAYPAGKGGTADAPVPDPASVVNGPAREKAGILELVGRANACPDGAALPCPQMVPEGDVGTRVVNYRNEPLALRVFDPETGGQAAGRAGDFSFVYRSDVARSMQEFNRQPLRPGRLGADLRPGDPATPLMRAYGGDNVRVRVRGDGGGIGPSVAVDGVRWLRESDSGWVNAETVGAGADFSFATPLLPGSNFSEAPTDHLVRYGTDTGSQWHGAWGLLRVYGRVRSDLKALPGNDAGEGGLPGEGIANAGDFNDVCPKDAPVRRFNVTAVSAARVLPGGALVYNENRGADASVPGPLRDPSALLLFNTRDLVVDPVSKEPVSVKPGVPVEPLVLRARAGECVEVSLKNALSPDLPVVEGTAALPLLVDHFNLNHVQPSSSVGLNPQLVSRNPSTSGGINVGGNGDAVQTAPPGGNAFYRWYAGALENRGGKLVASPVEFGAVNLLPSDPVKHASRGLAATLVIEPEGASWDTDVDTRTAANVRTAGTALHGAGSFREIVLFHQDGLNLLDANGNPVSAPTAGEAFGASGLTGYNYRVDPLWFTRGPVPGGAAAPSRTASGGGGMASVSPVFTASAATPVRFRILQAGGRENGPLLTLAGHLWRWAPYRQASASDGGSGGENQPGAQLAVAPTGQYDVVLTGRTGGLLNRPGDYVFRDADLSRAANAPRGLLKVTP